MLTAKIQSHLRILSQVLLHFPSEEIRQAILNKEGASKNPDDFIGVPDTPILLTDYAYEAICDNGNIDLDSHSIFRLPQKVVTLRCCFIHLKQLCKALHNILLDLKATHSQRREYWLEILMYYPSTRADSKAATISFE